MYWLLEIDEQDRVREKIEKIEKDLSYYTPRRDQSEQIFPFNGRKDRAVASLIINSLIEGEETTVCDPFAGSGTFAYSALDQKCKVLANEWEPFTYRMMTAPFNQIPPYEQVENALELINSKVAQKMFNLYKTKCPKCGREIMFESIFYDRVPLEYYNPQKHERLGENGENVIFRSKQYKCECGCKEKLFDEYDQQVVDAIPEPHFISYSIIENPRINFSKPEFTEYGNLFSKRQKCAVLLLMKAISELPDGIRPFMEDVFYSMAHLAKYVDYRGKSQDNHCPEKQIREYNLLYKFRERAKERYEYLNSQNFNTKDIKVSCNDFRLFLSNIDISSVDIIITDPPYGDNAQYFEHAQRVQPLMGYYLRKDKERLKKEVVVSNSPERKDKNDREQFLKDIETLFKEGARIIKDHGYFVLYFRPTQSDWLSDLNKLKTFGRKNGLEPLISLPVDNNDPSMRVLASAAWTFKKDVCFIFIKLKESERRWYEKDEDIDEIVYLAAKEAATNDSVPFTFDTFLESLKKQLRAKKLSLMMTPQNMAKFQSTLQRFAYQKDALYIMKGGLNPYITMNRDMDAVSRLREFAPEIVERLDENPDGFTFEDYVIALSTYLENGTKAIIQQLHEKNMLVPHLLLEYAEKDPLTERFHMKSLENDSPDISGKINIRRMDAYDFEKLCTDFFKKLGYIKAERIGGAGDRGVDILLTNSQGEFEIAQCKRYKKGNNVGSTPIQRVDSFARTRHAIKSWVITTSDFTPDGRSEAELAGVKIINGIELIKMLNRIYPNVYTL